MNNEVCFFNESLLNSKECFDDVYKLASSFYKNIPVKEKVILWSQFVGEWTSESLSFIGHDDLVIAISKADYQ